MTTNPASHHPFRLDGETALITGGATGIGLGIAQAFVAMGARVVLAGRREAELKQAATELGAQASWRVHDVTHTEQSEALIDSIETQHGPLSILVNNAGNHLKKPAQEISQQELQQVLDVHVLGAFSLSRAAGARMVERGRGNILFISSLAALIALPYVAAYSTAKSAQLGMTRTLAVEWSPSGVRVNTIAPGFIDTEMMRKAVEPDPQRKAKIFSRSPTPNFGALEDIGWAAVYLASPAAKFVTGTCLVVDGGFSIGF